MNPENQNQGYGNVPSGQQPTYPNNNYQGTYQQPQQQGYAEGQYANAQYQQQATQPVQPGQQIYAGQPYQYTTPQPGNNKKVIAIIAAIAAVAIIAVIAVFAFGGGSNNSPSGVVKKFFSAVNDKDADKFVECLTPEIQSLIKLAGASELQGMMDEFTDGSDGKVTIKIINTKEDGDTAEVECELFIDGESKGTDRVPAVKVDGKWYIKIM